MSAPRNLSRRGAHLRYVLSPRRFSRIHIALAGLLLFSACDDATSPGPVVGNIRGLLEVDGKRMAGALVVIISADAPGPPREARTDDNGEFEFIGLEAGSYRVDQLRAPEGQPLLWLETQPVSIVEAGRNGRLTIKGRWDVHALEVELPEGRIARGDSLLFSVRTLGPNGEVLPATPSWESSDELIVQSPSPSGRAVALATGGARIVVSYEGVADSVDVQVWGELKFQAHSITNDPFDGLWLVARGEGWADSVPLDAHGGALLVTPYPIDREGVVFDVRAPDPHLHYHPSRRAGDAMFRSRMAAGTIGMTAILFPTTWAISEGQFAGDVLPVDPNLAFAYPNPRSHGRLFHSITLLLNRWPCGGHAYFREGTYCAPSMSWPRERFPIPLYFRHGGTVTYVIDGQDVPVSRRELSAMDSIHIWSHIHEMEKRFGRQLFRPARLEDLPGDLTPQLTNWRTPPWAISLAVIDSLSVITGYAGLGGAGRDDNSQGTIIEGRATISGKTSIYTDRDFDHRHFGNTVLHELGHALGFGHACFPSTMRTCFTDGDYPYRSDLPSRYSDPFDFDSAGVWGTDYDVALWSLYWAWHELAMEVEPDMNYLEAVAAQLDMSGNIPLPISFGELIAASYHSEPIIRDKDTGLILIPD